MVKFHNIGPRQHFVPQNLTSCKKVQKGKKKNAHNFPLLGREIIVHGVRHSAHWESQESTPIYPFNSG